MDPLIGAANFIHNNMANGTTWQTPAPIQAKLKAMLAAPPTVPPVR